MSEIFELKIRNPRNIFLEVKEALAPHREKEKGSVVFIVEGTKENPVIGIRYPGRRVKKNERWIYYKWTNLFDFEVVPYDKDGKELNTSEFTFEKLARDFYEHKRDNEDFWKLIEELYKTNTITKQPPELLGIDPTLFLLVQKWLWIEEDFNYRLKCEDLGIEKKSELSYKTEKKGVGRGKQFCQLWVLKSKHFTPDEIGKIIPYYRSG